TAGSGQMRILPNGDVLVGGIYKAYHLNARGEIIGTYAVTGAQSLWSIALLPGGNEFLLGSHSARKLYRFKVAPGTNVDNQLQVIDVTSAPYSVLVYGGYTAAGAACGPAPAAHCE